MNRSVGTTVFALAMLAACERRAPPVAEVEAPATLVRDSAGARLVQAGFAPNDSGALLTVRDTVLNGSLPQQDGVIGVQALQPLADSSLVVFSASGPSLLRFAGSPLRATALGHAGTAPGEYGPRSTVLPFRGDTLMLWDADAGRVSRVTADGVGEHVLLDYPLPRLTTVSGVLDDGSVIGLSMVPPAEQQPGVTRADAALLRFAPDGALRDTLVQFRGPERVVQLGRTIGPNEGPAVRAVNVPFGRSTLWTVGQQSVLLLDTEACAVERYTADGTLALRLEMRCAIETVTETDRERFRSELLATARSRSDSAVRRRFVEEATFPPSKSTASGLLTDAWDRIWVRRPVNGLTDDWRWWVFDADGTPITALRLGREWSIASVLSRELLAVSSDRDDAAPVVVRITLPDALRRAP